MKRNRHSESKGGGRGVEKRMDVLSVAVGEREREVEAERDISESMYLCQRK